MTLEAEVLHYADNPSAKTASMAEAVEDADNFQRLGSGAERLQKMRTAA